MGMLLFAIAVVVVLYLVGGAMLYSTGYFDISHRDAFDFDKALAYTLSGTAILAIRAYKNVREMFKDELQK